jgi:hypothetical protein
MRPVTTQPQRLAGCATSAPSVDPLLAQVVVVVLHCHYAGQTDVGDPRLPPMRLVIGSLLVGLAVIWRWARFDFAVAAAPGWHVTVPWWLIGIAGLVMIATGFKRWR